MSSKYSFRLASGAAALVGLAWCGGAYAAGFDSGRAIGSARFERASLGTTFRTRDVLPAHPSATNTARDRKLAEMLRLPGTVPTGTPPVAKTLSPRLRVPGRLRAPGQVDNSAPSSPRIPGLEAQAPRLPIRKVATLNPPRASEPPVTDIQSQQPPGPQMPIDATLAAIVPPLRPSPPLPQDTALDPVLAGESALRKQQVRGGCFVARGSNDRMILVCDGRTLTPGQAFRAVIEGESAFRGLRGFDPAGRIVDAYGFTPAHFRTLSTAPQTANDLIFLRELRASGSTIRVKGRRFDLYTMRGELGTATVLIERATAPDRASLGVRD